MLVDESRCDEWNDFVRACAHPSVMQSWEWGRLKSATGWRPMVIAVEDGGRITAGALVLERPLPRVGRGLLYAPRGPILDWDDSALLGRWLAQVRAVARERRAIALKIDPCVTSDRTDVVAALQGAGFRFVGDDDPDLGGTQPRYVMKTDLTPEPEELLASFHGKWRYNIRLAGRKGVTVREGTRADLPEFYRILEVTAERDEFRVRGVDYYEALHDILVPAGLARLFVAEFEGQMVAGAIVFGMGREAVYVYGASDNEHRNLMPNHLLQWEMMQWARAQGCTVYDFRGVSREVDGEPLGELGGLNRFKRGFGAQYSEYIGEYDLVFSPLWYRVYTMARGLRGG